MKTVQAFEDSTRNIKLLQNDDKYILDVKIVAYHRTFTFTSYSLASYYFYKFIKNRVNEWDGEVSIKDNTYYVHCDVALDYSDAYVFSVFDSHDKEVSLDTEDSLEQFKDDLLFQLANQT